MKIAIYYRSPIAYTHVKPDASPLPGTETAVLEMAYAFGLLGHEVRLYTHPDELRSAPRADIFVVKRNPAIALLYPAIAPRVFFWSPDLRTELSFVPLSAPGTLRRFISGVYRVIAISEFQAGQYRQLGIPKSKIIVSRNGVRSELYQGKTKKNPGACLYVSGHGDGLEYLSGIWEQIHARVPGSTLTVIASRSLYREAVSKQTKRILSDLKKCSGVTVAPLLPRKDLAKTMLRTAVLLYPNTELETSCMTVIEARVAGAVIVTSARGALPETARGNILILGTPKSAVYRKKFINAAVDMLEHPAKRAQIGRQNRRSLSHYNWITIAREWESVFSEAAHTTI